MAGPTKKPLYQKLGIKAGQTLQIKNSPVDYETFFDQLPSPLQFVDQPDQAIDFVHLFAASKLQLEQDYLPLYKSLKKDGQLWVSWPKGSSGIETDLKRDYIREYVLDNGLVDVKVCSINEQWSGLKFVFRTKDRI